MADEKENYVGGKIREKFGLDEKDIKPITLGYDELNKLEKSSVGRFLKGNAAARSKKSIIGMASKNTFEFPVFVSKSVPLDYATATCSLLEQVYASYLQMAISMDPVVDARSLTKVGGGGGYLSRFKTNTTKYVEYTDSCYAHDACHNVIDNGDAIVEFDMISIDDQVAQIINENCSYEDLDEFNHFFMEAKNNQPDDNRMKHDEFVDPYVEDIVDAKIEKYNDDFGHYPDTDEIAAFRREAIRKAEKDWAEYDHTQEQIRQLKMKNNEMHDIQDGKKSDPERSMTKAQIDNLNKQTELYKDQIKKIDHELSQNEKNANSAERRARTEMLKKQKASYEANINKINSELRSVSEDQVAKAQYKTIKDENGNEKKVRVMSSTEELYDKRIKTHNEAEKSKFDTLSAARSYARDYEGSREARERMLKSPEMMDETKIRKLNSLKPLMMRCQIRVTNSKGDFSEYPVELICGVKVHCRLVNPEALPDMVKYPLKDMNPLTRNVKYKAGELKFFKDILFNIKEKKQTAIDSKDPNKRWYRRLYQLAHMKGDSFVSQAISGNGSTGLIPNAALIITNSDAENIKSAVDIDILSGSVGCKLCRELFMMALIVIDQDQESLKMLTPDINSDYEVHSLASVNRQLAELDTAGAKTRDIFKLLK